MLQVKPPRKNCSAGSLLRNSSSLPGILPSLPDSFPAVLAVKVPLRRGSAATLTAAGRRESAPLGCEGCADETSTALLLISSPQKNSASLAASLPHTGHYTAPPSTLLPLPHAASVPRDSADS